MPPGRIYKHKTAAEKVASLVKTVTKGTRKKRTSRKSTVAANTQLVFNKPSPFPIVWKNAKQSYTEKKLYAVGALGTFGVENIFRLNSQFDPDITGVGHQPYGRDTFALIYGRYKVNSVTIEVTFSNPSAGASLACAVQVLNPTQVLGLVGHSYTVIKERPQSLVKLLNEGGGSQKVTIKKSWPMHVLLGCTKLQFESNIGLYDALAANDPSVSGLARLVVAIADFGGAGTGTCDVSTKITMNTDWYQRRTLPQS